MKAILFWLILIASVIFTACSMQTVESQTENPESEIRNPTSKSPVLIELYTSEGCSSCPPADAALAFLEKEQPFMQAEIITLALHVDYWNDLGWRDEYSSPLYSQRQTVYAQKLKLNSTYTPQMIVDGRIEFVGSSTSEASKAITDAAKSPKADIAIERGGGDQLKIKILDIPKHADASVFLAVAENNLASNVKRGENAGKNLAHTSVVRELRPIGRLEAKSDIFEQQISVPRNPQWNAENLNYVVFVQENESRKIIGTARISAVEKTKS